jgi:hypothetical protein
LAEDYPFPVPSSPMTAHPGEDGAPRLTAWERIKYTMVRPDDDPKEAKDEVVRTVEEIQADIARSNDKERAIGLVAAPVAALIGLIISSASINYAKTHNQSYNVYEKLTYVLLGLALLILVTSWLRKRMFQGITLALYGLAIFQLHYTYFGFAAPFLLAGAWYLVRAYRLQQELKRAEAAGPTALRPKGSAGAVAAPPPRRSKRYTPPS